VAGLVYIERKKQEAAMSQRGMDFANAWLINHLHDEPYDLPQDMIEDTVQHLIADAQAQNISVEEIEEDMGRLHDFIASEYERRTEEEAARLTHPDDPV
jgi:hypothetical protein